MQEINKASQIQENCKYLFNFNLVNNEVLNLHKIYGVYLSCHHHIKMVHIGLKIENIL